MKIKYITLLILLSLICAGCARSYHSHPHDHGISNLKGLIIETHYNIRELKPGLDRLENLEVKLLEAKERLISTEKRLTKLEENEQE